MKFGKTLEPQNIDFNLPNWHSLNEFNVLPHQLRFQVGFPTFNEPEYKGSLFPVKTPQKQFLKEYAKQFDAIELNATHYKIPAEHVSDFWLESVQNNTQFKFYPKMPQAISARREMHTKTGVIDDFLKFIIKLNTHFGACFMQLPDYFKLERLPELELLLDTWPRDVELLLEFRHTTWFENENSLKIMAELAAKYNLGFVLSDVALRRDVLHMLALGKTQFIRFNAYQHYPTDWARLQQWLLRFKQLELSTTQNIALFLHSSNKVYGVGLMNDFIQALNTEFKANVSSLLNYNDQPKLF